MSEVARLCCVRLGPDEFGIETAAVQEVLGAVKLRAVPRAPAFVAGVLAYRGEVLLAVSLAVLLGRDEAAGARAVVMRDAASGERYALLVDSVADVVEVAGNLWEPNPATLDARSRRLFGGVYRMAERTVIKLEPARVQPSALVEGVA